MPHLTPLKISPHILCKHRGPKSENFTIMLLNFGVGAYPLSDFHEICRFCTSFQNVSAVKVWMDLLKRLRSYGAFTLRRSGSPKFSALLAGKLCVEPQRVFELHDAKCGGARISPAAAAAKNVEFLLCLSVCLSIMLLNVRVCVPISP